MDIDLKAESEFQHDTWIGPSQVEDIAGKLHVLVGDADEKAELSVERGAVGLGPLRHEAELKPVDWGIGELRPVVVVTAGFFGGEDKFVGDGGLKFFVSKRRLAAGCDSIGSSKYSADNWRHVQRQIFPAAKL